MSAVLVIVGAAILVLLGVGHVVFTLQSTPAGGPMMPTDPAVRDAMVVEGGLGLAPALESTLYRAWVGFNLSHSLGVIVVGAILLWHAVADLGAAVNETWFVVLAAVPIAYFAMAVKYWFDKPRDAIAVAVVLVWAGIVIELA